MLLKKAAAFAMNAAGSSIGAARPIEKDQDLMTSSNAGFCKLRPYINLGKQVTVLLPNAGAIPFQIPIPIDQNNLDDLAAGELAVAICVSLIYELRASAERIVAIESRMRDGRHICLVRNKSTSYQKDCKNYSPEYFALKHT